MITLAMTLSGLMDNSETIGDVRGRGLFIGVEFVDDRASRDPAPEIASRVAAACRDRGLLIQVVASNVWRIAPPLTVSDDEIDRAASIIHDSLTECDEA